jgi:hypothetical protein
VRDFENLSASEELTYGASRCVCVAPSPAIVRLADVQ